MTPASRLVRSVLDGDDAPRPDWMTERRPARPPEDAPAIRWARACAEFETRAARAHTALGRQRRPDVAGELLALLLAETRDAAFCRGVARERARAELPTNQTRLARLQHTRTRVQDHFGLKLSEQAVLDLEREARRAPVELHLPATPSMPATLYKRVTLRGVTLFPVLVRCGEALELCTVYTREMLPGGPA